jgi:gliding motility-associated-like protein
MKNKILLLFCIISLKIVSQTLPCSNTTVLNNITNYCSNNAQYTNVPVLTGTTTVASCWTSNPTQDVWFSFTATQTDVLISVSGNDGSGAGTMNNPSIALYTGPCTTTLTEIGCSNGTSSATQLYKGGLSPGTTYLIRISTTTANKGTFKLCLNNYTPTANPGADCSGAVYICNKNPISVAGLSGGGLNNQEPESSTCFQGSPETNSCWYTFTCQTSGTLTFDLIPSNVTNDIDFIFYKLSTTNVCGTRTAIRCNCSSCVNSNGPINGYTGLNTTSTDTSVTGGCNPPQNSYCKQANLVAGLSYAILINNFSTASGFTINWGGTSTFLGPTPKITASDTTICAGQTVTFNGSTSTNCNSLSWNFTSGGSPTSATGVGPTTVTYSTLGSYVAILDGVSTGGCETVTSMHVLVSASPTVTIASPSTLTCSSPGIQLSATATPLPVTYTWTGSGIVSGVNTATPSINSPGTYTVIVANTIGCSTTATVAVTQKGTPTATAAKTDEFCGSITGTATVTASGGTTPYTYSWTGTAQTTSVVTIAPGNYTVTVTDANNCTSTATLTILNVSSASLSVNNPTICIGDTATLTVSGGTSYAWVPSTGLSATTGSIVKANPGSTTVYTITGNSAGTCSTTTTATVTVNPLPAISVSSYTICIGQQTATLTANGAATYIWNPVTGLTPSTGSVVKANPTYTQNYTVTGTDANGCVNTRTTSITVNPLPIIAVSSASICAGQKTATLTANGANNYTWTPVTNLTTATGSVVTATPPSTQNYTVTGTDTNGCVNTGTTSVTVYTLPKVTVTSTSICLGFPGTITASGANTYIWNTSATGSTFTDTPNATSNYTVSGTDINSCTNTAVGTITVSPTLTITVNNGSICIGQQTATLTAGGAVNYTWNPATGLTPATGSVLVANPTTTTIYTITGSVGSCSATAISTVTVNPLPVPTATANTPCLSQQTLNIGAMPNGMQSYSWTGPNSFAASGQIQSIGAANVVSADAGTYTLLVTDKNKCTNTTTVQVTINPKPMISATGATVCVGQTIKLSSNGAGAGTYNWSGPSPASTYTLVSNSQDTSITNATTVMEGIYNVIGTDAHGCQNAAFAQVIVNNPPTINASSSTICEGQEVATLTASGAGTGGSYSWKPLAGLSLNTNGSIVTGMPSSTQIYTVTGTDVSGCVNATMATITVDSLPRIIVNSDSICSGQQTATLTASGANTYAWSPPIGLSASTGNIVTASPQATQNYTVTGTSVNGCINKAFTVVVVYPIPIPDFDYTHQPVSILDPRVYFVNQSNGSIASYNWSFGDIYNNKDTSSSVKNPLYAYSDIGTYDVTLSIVSTSGCSASVVKPVIINPDYTLYVPNAFTPNGDGRDEIFKAEGEGITDFKMYVFDRWGLLLFYTNDINAGWDGHYQGKGPNILQQDVYVWKIEASDFNNIPKNLHGTVTLLR